MDESPNTSSTPSDAERAARVRSLRELETEITELAGHLNAANHRLLKLIAEFDAREGWSSAAVQSCAHWLNWKCGIALGAAREKVRTAHALTRLPKIAAAMRRGELSYCKVRAITRVACPATEEYFLNIAHHGTGHHVETLVRHYRRAKEAQELSREARQQANRCLRYRWDDDGSLILNASLPAEVGALVLKALEGAVEDCPTPTPEPVAYTGNVPPDDPIDRPSRAARRADALGMLAESFLAHGAESMSGGDRHQIVVHVSAETLMAESTSELNSDSASELNSRPSPEGSSDGGDFAHTCDIGTCEIERGPAISAETARRLACDASIVTLLENANGDPLNVGRKTRAIPPALRRALNARDRGCRFPGCTHTRYVDAHHIHHWAHGGETRLGNLALLCKFHHRKVHEGAVKIVMLDDGALRFTDPHGHSLDSVAPHHTHPIVDWRQLPAAHQEHGIYINARTAVSRWGGERMDYGTAVDALLQRSGVGAS